MLQEVVQQIENTCRDKINEVHTSLPGEIISFNPGAGTATVKPSGRFTTQNDKRLAYPQISDVPVVFPYCQSLSCGFAFPVKRGDNCLIVVSEVELDEWRSGAESESNLRFDLTSAICIPGLLCGGGDIIEQASKQNAVIMKAGDNLVMATDDGITLDTGDTTLKLTDSGAELTGNLKVKGSITATQSITPWA